MLLRRFVVSTLSVAAFVAVSMVQASACSNVVASFLDPIVGVDVEGAADIHLTSGVSADVTAVLKIKQASAVWYEPIESLNNLPNFSAFNIYVDGAKHVQIQATRATTNPGALAIMKIRIFLCDPIFT
jgi:hypothetical protein